MTRLVWIPVCALALIGMGALTGCSDVAAPRGYASRADGMEPEHSPAYQEHGAHTPQDDEILGTSDYPNRHR